MKCVSQSDLLLDMKSLPLTISSWSGHLTSTIPLRWKLNCLNGARPNAINFFCVYSRWNLPNTCPNANTRGKAFGQGIGYASYLVYGLTTSAGFLHDSWRHYFPMRSTFCQNIIYFIAHLKVIRGKLFRAFCGCGGFVFHPVFALGDRFLSVLRYVFLLFPLGNGSPRRENPATRSG